MYSIIKKLIDEEISIIDKQNNFKNKEIKKYGYEFFINRIVKESDIWTYDTWNYIYNQIDFSEIKNYLHYQYFVINLFEENQYMICIMTNKYKYIIPCKILINE